MGARKPRLIVFDLDEEINLGLIFGFAHDEKMSKHMYSTLTDKELKEEGNRMFGLRKYDDAINFYTKAIIKNPDVAHYFTNRALCHLKLMRWDQASADCRRALDVDTSSIKGHFLLGEALVGTESYDEAIKHLQIALELVKEQKLNFGVDIASALRAARKKRFSVLQEKQIAQEIELQWYLNKLIREDKDAQLAKLMNEERNNEVAEDKAREIEEKCETYTNELNSLFVKVDDRKKKIEVPDYLCGKISFEILQEPVITPSGITYEKKDIEEHLHRVGHFDPVTRVKLTQDQLIPNFAMKEVVDLFLQENECALDY